MFLRRILAVSFLLALAISLIAACLPKTNTTNSKSAGKIFETGSMSVARADHTATLLPDGRVLIAGGMVENGVFLDSMEIFDPSTAHFSPAGAMSSKRVGHSATLLPNGKILIAGGLAARGEIVSSAELYDTRTGKLSAAAPLHEARNGHEAILLPNGKVLILGGYDGRRFLSSVEIYDPAANQFLAAGNLQIARGGAVAVLLKDGTVLLTGGASGSESNHKVLQSAEIYNPQTRTSMLVADMTSPRYKHAATLLTNGQVLITGGSDEHDWSGVYDTAEIYDPASRKFTQTAKMTSKRFKLPHATALLKNGNALIAGGNRVPEVFEASSGKFEAVSGTMGEPKLFATATLLNDGRVLIAGGYGNGTPERGPLSSKQSWIYEP